MKKILFLVLVTGMHLQGYAQTPEKNPRCHQMREKSVRLMDQIIKETAGMGSSGQPGHGPTVVALEKELETLKRKIATECKST